MINREKLTITQKVLLTLWKCKRGASWRRLAGWYNKFSYSAMYQTLGRLKRTGLVSKSEFDGKKFVITEEGMKKLEKDGLLKVRPGA